MKKRLLAFALTLAMALGLTVPAMAYNTKDFVDVPKGNWAYDSVMRMADKGIVKGTGNKTFSPNATATAEQFITLVGRIVFPEVKASGSGWSGPYVAEAKAKGMLTGTTVTDGNLKSAITRYDMAVILRSAAKLLEAEEKLAEPSAIGDYGMTPTMYADAVRAVYGAGLITGDDKHNFNGQNPMRRNELAVVMDRLLKLREAYDTAQEEKAAQEAARQERMAELVWYHVELCLQKIDRAIGAPAYDKREFFSDVPIKLYYTPDGGKTSTLVTEGVTGGLGIADFIFQAPRGWGYDWRPEGSGFYASAETTYNGERLVTNDLRTDDKAFTALFGLTERTEDTVEEERDWIDVELTPPNGAKAKLTFKGTVEEKNVACAGFEVQLHFKDGTVLGEAVTDSTGHFTMDFEVDALDNGFDHMVSQYYVTCAGTLNGVRYEHTTPYAWNGELVTRSLYTLQVYIPNGGPGVYSWTSGEYHTNP